MFSVLFFLSKKATDFVNLGSNFGSASTLKDIKYTIEFMCCEFFLIFDLF